VTTSFDVRPCTSRRRQAQKQNIHGVRIAPSMAFGPRDRRNIHDVRRRSQRHPSMAFVARASMAFDVPGIHGVRVHRDPWRSGTADRAGDAAGDTRTRRVPGWGELGDGAVGHRGWACPGRAVCPFPALPPARCARLAPAARVPHAPLIVGVALSPAAAPPAERICADRRVEGRAGPVRARRERV
jgi:hypothetical protein